MDKIAGWSKLISLGLNEVSNLFDDNETRHHVITITTWIQLIIGQCLHDITSPLYLTLIVSLSPRMEGVSLFLHLKYFYNIYEI